MEGVSQHLWRVVVRKMVLAALAAWILIGVIALPSVVHAQGRGEGQGRARPQMQVQPPSDFRRGGGFAGMLRDIAGARLDRAHADRRSDRPPPANDNRNQRRR
jgi:hypothetical protein